MLCLIVYSVFLDLLVFDIMGEMLLKCEWDVLGRIECFLVGNWIL